MGKTTFLKTIAGRIPALSGKCQFGQGIHIGYFDQQTGQIVSDKRVFEHFSEAFPDLTIKEAKKLLGHYLFRGEETGRKISDLSGGEKSRLFLAELINSGPNLLLLDEPTNHMDIPARETLESAFSAYTGSMLFISHDRYFVNKLATSLLIFEPDQVLYYPFGYEHYLEHLKKKEEGGSAGADAILAENTKLVNELHAVPERRRIQSARLSTDQSYTDWQLLMAREAMDKAAHRIEEMLADRDEEAYWLDAAYRDAWVTDYERLLSDYEETCLTWYEKYLDYREAFASYRD